MDGEVAFVLVSQVLQVLEELKPGTLNILAGALRPIEGAIDFTDHLSPGSGAAREGALAVVEALIALQARA